MKPAVAAIVVVLAMIPYSSVRTSASQTEVSTSAAHLPEWAEGNGHHGVWNLAQDIGATGNQIGFNQGAGGVWFFMASSRVVHDPLLYRFIREFDAPAVAFTPGFKVPDGFSCWQETKVLPDVCFNFTEHPITLEAYDVPPRTVSMHPIAGRFTIVAWRSPLTGSVAIQGSFTDQNPNCGNGILWSIDKNDKTVLSDDLPNGTSQNFSTRVRVRQNDVLYFIVDANNDYSCDSTGLDVTIHQHR